MPDQTLANRIGQNTGEVIRLLVYGFLAARPGVPFLPHDNTLAVALTLAAALIAVLPVSRKRPELRVLLAFAAAASVVVIVRLDGPTTSIVAVGCLIAALAKAADTYAFVYGVVAGVAAMAVATQAWDLTLFKAPELVLSGQSFTPDRGGHEALILAGFLFLTMTTNLLADQWRKTRAAVVEAEKARDDAIVDERARIARELHDVVSHHVTGMTLQAEAAAMTGDKQALSAVASAGREALTELRRMLGVLRHPDDVPAGALDPQPDLDQLDQLAARTSSGPTVSLERRGDVRALSAGLELCAYRIVQESMTNSTKHSDATTVEVVLTYGEDELVVDVVDNGRPLVAARVGSGGLGLVGMRERVALLDGELTTGPRSARRDTPCTLGSRSTNERRPRSHVPLHRRGGVDTTGRVAAGRVRHRARRPPADPAPDLRATQRRRNPHERRRLLRGVRRRR